MVPPPDVSVVIPTKNGGALLGAVLDAVCGQSASFPFEVLILDSGSTDGSPQLVRDRARENEHLRLVSIPPESFGHGRTRNRGIAETAGRFVAFLTQDATPVSPSWIQELVEPLRRDDRVGGAFGKHVPYPHSRLYSRRDVTLHFEWIALYPEVIGLDDVRSHAGDPGFKQVAHFFSDCNSVVRRRTWEEIPYPDVAFGEDQVWAERILAAGWKKAYAAEAPVYHSHDFRPGEMFRRQRVEAAFFRREFGYRVCPGLPALAAGFARSVLADYQFGRRTAGRVSSLVAALADAPVNLARMCGQYAGTRGPSRIRPS